MRDAGEPRPHPTGRRAHTPGDFAREWSPADAIALAQRTGIGTLGDRHWKVIASYREEAARTGAPPRLQRLESITGLSAEEMHRLFPGNAEALIGRLAGLRGRRGRAHGGGGAPANG